MEQPQIMTQTQADLFLAMDLTSQSQQPYL